MTRNDDAAAVLGARVELVWGIDRRDWQVFRRRIPDSVVLDYSSHDPNRRPGPVDADYWLGFCRTLFTGLDATQHSLTNARVIECDGREATTVTYVVAEHMWRDDSGRQRFYTLGGWYADRLVASDDGWLLAEMALHVEWDRGEKAILAQAQERGARLLGDAAVLTPPGARG